MAVPFNIPNNEISDELIIEQIYRLLAVLQQQVMRNRDASSQTSTRVRNAPSTARRSRDEDRSVPTANRESLPDLVTSLRHLAPSTMPPVHNTITGIVSRADDSTCCEGDGNEIIKLDISNSQIGVFVVEHRIQNEEVQRQSSKNGQSGGPSRGLISKLVHGPMSGPIWTAVICMVGWQLLRTR